MKRLGKSISVIIALLIIVFSVLTVCGFSYYKGDFEQTVIRGLEDVDRGIDIGGGAKVILGVPNAASGDEAPQISTDVLHDTAQVIEDRAAKFGLKDYEVYVNRAQQTVSLVVPNDVDCEYSAAEVASYLTTYGDLTLRGGSSYTDASIDSSNSQKFTNPTEDSLQIILGTDNVSEVQWFKDTSEGTETYWVSVLYDETGLVTLANATSPDTGYYYGGTVSIWLDNVMLSMQQVEEANTYGEFTFTNEGMTQQKAKLFTAIIDTGVLPTADLSVVSVQSVAPSVGNDSGNIVLFAGLAALVAIAVIMIIRYRLSGVVSVFAMALQCAVLLAFITGFLVDGGIMMSVAGMVGLAVSVLLTVFSTGLIAEKIRTELRHGSVMGNAVTVGIKDSRNTILDMSVVLAVISLVGLFLFGTSGLSIAIFGGSVVSGVYNFCLVLFIGAIANCITGYFVPQLMLRSLYSFSCLSKPSLFGGAKK